MTIHYALSAMLLLLIVAATRALGSPGGPGGALHLYGGPFSERATAMQSLHADRQAKPAGGESAVSQVTVP